MIVLERQPPVLPWSDLSGVREPRTKLWAQEIDVIDSLPSAELIQGQNLRVQCLSKDCCAIDSPRARDDSYQDLAKNVGIRVAWYTRDQREHEVGPHQVQAHQPITT